jgi:hypothetical protein
MFFLLVKIWTGYIITDKVHCDSEHNNFDSDEDAMPAALNISNGQERVGI